MHFTLLILIQGFIYICNFMTSILIVDASPQKNVNTGLLCLSPGSCTLGFSIACYEILRTGTF